MMNKITKNILRIWISITSIIVFAVGWITLAHAQKPVPLSTQIVEFASPTNPVDLAPIPLFEDLTRSVNRPAFSQPNVNFNIPRLRTRGS
jgi:hypothetical protein